MRMIAGDHEGALGAFDPTQLRGTILEHTQTVDGWPLAIVQDDDTIAGVYAIAPWTGVLVIAGMSAADARAILVTARPDLHGDVPASIAELFS